VNKTFEANKQKFEVGCVWKGNEGYYRRVDYVGNERINCGSCCGILKRAEETEFSGASWSKADLENVNAKIVAYAKCGVDRNNDVVRRHDKVEDEYGDIREVLGAIDSSNDGVGYFILRKNASTGWIIGQQHWYTLIKPKEESIKTGDIITAELKGNVYKLKVVE